ncbi:MAG: tRNA guanosine(34) transglycosylase Tgt, partial [Patescibacteria group bacterium]
MADRPLSFEIVKRQPGTLGRAGVIHTPHGDIETPAFVVVGTKGTVKSVKPEDMREYVGNQVALANTYHLFLQPGDDVVKEAGGLHRFANWNMPTMTDSGGFQVFSLGAAFGKGVTKFAKSEANEETIQPHALNVYSKEFAIEHGKLCIIDEEGVTFTSHLDGSLHRFTAERSIEIQHNIGADIIIAFDECTSPTADYEYQKEAMNRTHRWAKRSILAHKQNYQALKKQGLYGVVQGGGGGG